MPRSLSLILRSLLTIPESNMWIKSLCSSRIILKLKFSSKTFCYSKISLLLKGSLKMTNRASLVAQWLRICLPMQGTRVQGLVREDPTCRGATGPVSHSYWACASLEPVLRNKRGRDSERAAHRDEEWPPLAATRESPRTETKTQHSHK